jgi:hypothetical protein
LVGNTKVFNFKLCNQFGTNVKIKKRFIFGPPFASENKKIKPGLASRVLKPLNLIVYS